MGSTVKDVMTTQVVAVRKAASFKEMAVKMRDSRIGAFPVVDDGGRVVGVVSAADMLNKEADLAAEPRPLSSLLPSHGLGLDCAIGLARALDRMPGTLILHAVEAADVGQGAGLTGAVAEVIEVLTAAVLHDLDGLGSPPG